MTYKLSETEKAIISFLKDNPYSEEKTIIEAIGKLPDFDKSLKHLTDNMILIELTAPSDSSLESRVPKKIYMLNPEKENELEGI
ncbi:MAG: hypothetical protein PWQ70_1587 [Clostridiales bacterium]|uniref:hypothetical protein n=1 Tax=Acetomicrobium sp. UBA5826 TaxID=1946039 RepID=UPI00257DAB53|nr:hypothetical protein [Acetomicrobium sp. UBA5826]MDK2799968.1 hypothetical protein [Clostridiales bacterium]